LESIWKGSKTNKLPPNSSAAFKIGNIQSDEVDRYRGDITNISTKPFEFQNESTGINKN